MEGAEAMKASDYVAGFLETAGVTHAFELSGGMIAHLLDSIHRRGTPRLVSVHHEQAGAFAAEAVGCLTGRPAVALGTSGPGALNLVSGMAGCYYDSVPALFLVGQVQTYLKRRDRPIRQFGLQECDFPTVARPLAKAVFAVERASDLPTVLEEAWVESMSGRPGPVVIEIPFDVQASTMRARV